MASGYDYYDIALKWAAVAWNEHCRWRCTAHLATRLAILHRQLSQCEALVRVTNIALLACRYVSQIVDCLGDEVVTFSQLHCSCSSQDLMY